MRARSIRPAAPTSVASPISKAARAAGLLPPVWPRCRPRSKRLDSGSHVVVSDDLYGGTYRLFERVRRRSANLDFTFIDMTRSAKTSRARCKPNTRMVWVETPSNPLLKMIDLEAVAKIARAAQRDLGFRQHLRQPVDPAADRVRLRHGDSFRDEISQRPFRHGRRRCCRRRKQGARRSDAFLQNSVGAIAGPFDSFLAMRGLKTLALADGAALRERAGDRATGWRRSRRCESVSYPGLKAHPQHELAKRADARALAAWSRSILENRSRRHAAFSREHASLFARGKPGRRRKPGQSSRAHDARRRFPKEQRTRSASPIRSLGCRSASRTWKI